jgi:hypothetical protein
MDAKNATVFFSLRCSRRPTMNRVLRLLENPKVNFLTARAHHHSKIDFPHYAELGNLYDRTIPHLAINRSTRVICQGFTGKQVFIKSTTFSVIFQIQNFLIFQIHTIIYLGHFPF